jgi:death-on-curing protein
LAADQGTVYEFVMGVASGEIDEDGAAAFFRDHIEPIEQDRDAPPA